MKGARTVVEKPQLSTAERIALELRESAERPVWQIRMVVKSLGAAKALQLLAETQQIEQGGGMMVPDGSRRRTPGGVFFALARKRLPKGDRMRIFGLPQGQQKPVPPEAPPESVIRPLSEVPARARRRLVEVSAMTRYRPPTRVVAGATQDEEAPPPSSRPQAEQAPAPPPPAGPAPPTEPVRPRPRRIVTIADLKGRETPSAEDDAASEAGRTLGRGGARRRGEVDSSAEPQPSVPMPKTRAEWRQYISKLLERQSPANRQRILLDLLLADMETARPEKNAVDLPTRLTVVMAHRLGYAIDAIARQVFGESNRTTRRRAEAIVGQGIDFALLEKLLSLAEHA